MYEAVSGRRACGALGVCAGLECLRVKEQSGLGEAAAVVMHICLQFHIDMHTPQLRLQTHILLLLNYCRG